jgi:hypothetical protein
MHPSAAILTLDALPRVEAVELFFGDLRILNCFHIIYPFFLYRYMGKGHPAAVRFDLPVSVLDRATEMPHVFLGFSRRAGSDQNPIGGL